MSNHGHYSKQYYGNKIDFPEESFLISGISFYKENCKNIDYKSILSMKLDKENKFDKEAIAILYEDNLIGYVPKSNEYVKNICKEYIQDNLVILNIKQIKNNLGVRVIPETFYKDDKVLESDVFFSDDI